MLLTGTTVAPSDLRVSTFVEDESVSSIKTFDTDLFLIYFLALAYSYD